MPTASSSNDPEPNPISKAIYNIITKIPSSSEVISSDPAKRSRSIIRAATLKATLLSGGLALPPGPVGMLTVLPDLVGIWHVQRQMVADIASCYGKRESLNRELMLYCLFRHGAASPVRDMVTRVGERVVVHQGDVHYLGQVLSKLGVRIGQRVTGRTISRWIPIVGALGIAAYANYDTGCVGDTSVDVFSRDIEVEIKRGESSDDFQKP